MNDKTCPDSLWYTGLMTNYGRDDSLSKNVHHLFCSKDEWRDLIYPICFRIFNAHNDEIWTNAGSH